MMETKYKVWDKEKKSYWPEQFTLIELAASHRFPSNADRFYVIEPVTPAPDADAVDKLQRANHLLSGSANLLHADIDKGNEMIAALVEALRPFAACAEMWEGDDPGWILHRSRSHWPGKPDLNITVGDLQRAAAALASVEGGE